MKKIINIFIFTVLSLSLFAFEWPKTNVSKESFSSYFAQLRGKKISTSLVFKEADEVKAAEDGRLLVIMIEPENDSDFFPSTLGTSVIIAHEDNLLSVYGNLDKETLSITRSENAYIESGSIIAQTGSSGWQEDANDLEFQIIDTKNSSAINPKILMTRLESETKYSLYDISLMNRSGDFFSINTTKNYPSGLYKIYQKRNTVVTPVSTSVLYNGVVIDTISYNTIIQENGKNCVNGIKKKYTTAEVYPKEDLFLLGEAMLTPGKTTLGLTITDALGQTHTLNYNINAY